MEEHVISMRSPYRDKCKAMVASLCDDCGSYVELEVPKGWYLLWVKCKRGTAAELIQASADEGLIFPLGSICLVDKVRDDNHFRLAYTRSPFEHLHRAGKRLRRAFEKSFD